MSLLLVMLGGVPASLNIGVIDVLKNVAVILGVITGGAAVVTLGIKFKQWVLNRRDEKIELKNNIQESKEERSNVSAKLEIIDQKLDGLVVSQRSILKHQIHNSCVKALNQGWCSAELRETIAELFEEYKRFGGNSFIHDMVEKTFDLPYKDARRDDNSG